jgi:ferredoxin
MSAMFNSAKGVLLLDELFDKVLDHVSEDAGIETDDDTFQFHAGTPVEATGTCTGSDELLLFVCGYCEFACFTSVIEIGTDRADVYVAMNSILSL